MIRAATSLGLVFLAAITFGESWHSDVVVTVNATNTTMDITDKRCSKSLARGELRLSHGATIQVLVSGEDAGFEFHLFADGKDSSLNSNASQTLFTSIEEDGRLLIESDTGIVQTLRFIVAQEATPVAVLDAGAMYVWNRRSTYELEQALDSFGNEIPGTNVIVQHRNDQSVASSLSGKVYYLFGEEQSTTVDWILKGLTLGLHTPGSTRTGLFLGLTTDIETAGNFQIGFSFFMDRDRELAVSYGLSFSKGMRLRPGFDPGDLVGLTSIDSISSERWEMGYFVAINFVAVGGK